MIKSLKIALFILLLVLAAYFFGQVCKRIEFAYELILYPSHELLVLLLKFLLALGVLLVASGLVAALLQPTPIGYLAFGLSGIAILIGWRISILTFAFVMIYVLAGMVYITGVNREMKERIRFSIRSISTGQPILSIALILISCGSLYMGYEAHIEREGFAIPETYIELILNQMEKQIKLSESETEGGPVATELREIIKHNMEDFLYEKVMPYEDFIPLILSVSVFMSLMTLSSLLLWLPMLILGMIFSLLSALGVTKIVSGMREVQWLVID
jgi:hypothetical protein